MSQFIGRFHPLIVHLPIGFLLLGAMFDLLRKREKFSFLSSSVPFIYLVGALSAGIACISGYLLSIGDSYDPQMLTPHLWGGIIVTIFSLFVFVVYQYEVSSLFWIQKVTPFLLILGLGITGHLGGSLTHGEQYLIQHAPPMVKAMLGKEEEAEIMIDNVQEAEIYSHLVAPILEEKCYECHNAQKQKGKLRLDGPDMIEAGGRSGEALIISGDAGTSELFRRIILPEKDEKHMPPSGKPQLSGSELELIRWWINAGGAFEGKVKEAEPNTSVAAIFASLEGGVADDAEGRSMRQFSYATSVSPASEKNILAVQRTEAIVLPLWEGAPFLQVNYINARTLEPKQLGPLEKLEDQVVWLSLSNKPIGNEALTSVSKLKHLQKLYLNGTNITDEGLIYLSNLKHLVYINLVSTEVSGEGIERLMSIPALKELYVYNTKVTADDVQRFQEQWPEVVIELGGYELPVLEGDTSLLTMTK